MRAYRIGEFAKISGVSAKTLRYYDEVGILKPLKRDVLSGYRLYTAEQLRDLAMIVSLRQFGLSIEEISSVRMHRNTATDTRLLDSIRTRLEMDVARAQSALALLDAAEKMRDGGILRVTTKLEPARRVASMRARLGSYADVVELEAELARSLPQAVEMIGRGVLWHRCADSGSLEAEAFIAVNGLKREPRKIVVRDLPAVRMASVYCANHDEMAERGYDDLRAWMKIQGHVLAGPKYEIERDNMLEIAFPFEIANAA